MWSVERSAASEVVKVESRCGDGGQAEHSMPSVLEPGSFSDVSRRPPSTDKKALPGGMKGRVGYTEPTEEEPVLYR